MKKTLLIIIILALLVFILTRGNGEENIQEAVNETPTEEVTEESEPTTDTPLGDTSQTIREFDMDSFVEFVDEQPRPQFSLTEIEVNEGDLVRINVTVTKGTHDFKLDEFGIHEETPLDETVTVEFVADKAGEFIYYCNIPGHRENGHWGTLRVVEAS